MPWPGAARRASPDTEAIHEAGGIQAFAAAREADPDESTETALSADLETSDNAESPALAHESPVAEGEARSVQAGEPASAPKAPRMTLYRWRRARGECVSSGCPMPEGDDRVQCNGCRELRAERTRRRRALARTGAVLAPRLAEAAKAGRGVHLSADEVTELVSDDG